MGKISLKNLSWKSLIVIAVFVTALIYIIPTLNPDIWPHKTINLGLDLQGGMHLVLEVETEKAVQSTMERLMHELRSELKNAHVIHLGLKRKATTLSVQLKEDKNIEGFKKVLTDEFPDLISRSDTIQNGIRTLLVTLPDKEIRRIREMATAQALETIRNRIDEFGVSEPDIRIQGDDRILIQLPGITDTNRAKELIGRTARLDFKLLDETHDVADALKGKVPPGSEILYQQRTDPSTGKTVKTPMLIQKRTMLDGSYLTDARVRIDSQYNEPYVAIEFDHKGARIFAKITAENIKKRLAIVLDKTVYSAPVIQDEITGGKAQITGRFTMEEARDLAIVLRAGALPAPVHILEERTVGPSLGADSIRKGLVSMCVGGILVIIFMIIYYQFAGIVADIALAMNIVLIAAGLAGFQATLTLPGIAGIILTIGMAVDTNVLIFERIREELRLGRKPRAALAAGFERASLTILDANVTTLIAAVVLFQFGTGPVKGFAVTLSLGVLASLFTALIVSRVLFDFYLNKTKTATLRI
jgi:preprotein translocase subunit SecD